MRSSDVLSHYDLEQEGKSLIKPPDLPWIKVEENRGVEFFSTQGVALAVSRWHLLGYGYPTVLFAVGSDGYSVVDLSLLEWEAFAKLEENDVVMIKAGLYSNGSHAYTAHHVGRVLKAVELISGGRIFGRRPRPR